MSKPESAPPAPKTPIGNRKSAYVQKMLANDHHIFTDEFPSTSENVSAVVGELRAFPGCFDGPSDSFNLDKIADWIIRNLENFRQGQMAGAPTVDLGANPLLDEPKATAPPVISLGPGDPKGGGPATPSSVPTARTLRGAPVSPPGGARRPQTSPPGGAGYSRAPSGYQKRPPSQRTERRLVDMTKKTHGLTKENARLEAQVKLYQESWVMLGNTMGLQVEGEGAAEAVLEGVADLETTLDQVQEERDELREKVASLSSAPAQDLVAILDAFPTDVIQALGPDRVGEDLVARIKRAVLALGSKGMLGGRGSSAAGESGGVLQEEKALKERDEARDKAANSEEKAAASLKMLEEVRAQVADLERQLAGQAGSDDAGDGAAVLAERDRLWEVLGELVGSVAGTVKEMEEIHTAIEDFSGSMNDGGQPRAEGKIARAGQAEVQPLLMDGSQGGPNGGDVEETSTPPEEEDSSPDQRADEIHAESP